MRFLFFLTVAMLSHFAKAQLVKPHPMNVNADLEIATAWFHPNNSPGKVGRFEKLEIGISLPAKIEEKINNFISNLRGEKINPYDPDAINIKAEFYHKSEKDWQLVKNTFGFFYKSYSRDLENDKWLENTKQHHKFRVRFAPTKEGEWKCQLKIKLGNTAITQFDEFSFTCLPSNEKGYLQVSENKRFLETSGNNKTFFPVGAAITHSNYKSLTPTSSVKHLDWIDQLAKNGGNYFRLEMGGQNFLPDWNDYTNYTTKLEEMSELDALIDHCESKEVYFGVFRHHVEAMEDKYNDVCWKNNPYVKQLNLEAGQDYFQDSTAIEWQKKCIRYIFSRWGYSTKFSTYGYAEIDNWIKIVYSNKGQDYSKVSSSEREQLTETAITIFKPWLSKMYDYMDEIDASHVLKLSYYANTPSYELSGNPKGVFELGDVVGFNKYSDGKDRNFSKLGNGKTGRFGFTERLFKTYQKPVMPTEIGFRSGAKTDFVKIYCASGLDIHSDIWATSLSGNCASGMLWWWDRGVFDSDHTKHFSQLNAFFQDEDLTSQKFDAHKWSDKPGNSNYKANLESYYLKSEDKTKVLGWVHNMTVYWRNMGKYNEKIQELIDFGGVKDPCYSWDGVKLGHSWEPETDFTGSKDYCSDNEGAVTIIDGELKIKHLKTNPNFLGGKHWYRINYYSIWGDEFKVIRSEVVNTNLRGIIKVPLPTLDPINNPDYSYKISYLGKSRKRPK